MDTALLIAVRLAKQGFGPADHILQQTADIVLASMAYADFTVEYEAAYADLNKGE